MAMQVLCPHRGDHKIVRGRMHGPSQCPPAPGEYCDHRRLKRIAARRRAEKAEDLKGSDNRGVAVKNTSGSKAKSHRRGKAKGVEVVSR